MLSKYEVADSAEQYVGRILIKVRRLLFQANTWVNNICLNAIVKWTTSLRNWTNKSSISLFEKEIYHQGPRSIFFFVFFFSSSLCLKTKRLKEIAYLWKRCYAIRILTKSMFQEAWVYQRNYVIFHLTCRMATYSP